MLFFAFVLGGSSSACNLFVYVLLARSSRILALLVVVHVLDGILAVFIFVSIFVSP